MPSRILLPVRVAATLERTFQAFTSGVGKWWRLNGLFRFHVAGAGTLWRSNPGSAG